MPERVPARIREHVREDEQIEWWTKPPLRGVLAAVGPGIVAAAFGLPALWLYVTGTSNAAGGLAVLLGIVATSALTPAIQRVRGILFTTYVLTDERLVSVEKLVTARTNSVPLDQVSQIRQSHGAVTGWLGLADVQASAYGEAGATIRVPGLPEPGAFRTALAQLTVATATPRWLLRGD
jgi:hypothetical protein